MSRPFPPDSVTEVNLYDELVAIVRALEREKIEYAVCGDMAVAIHGLARATKGIDLLILREDLVRVLEAVRALQAVRALGFLLDGRMLPMGAGGNLSETSTVFRK